MINRYLLLSIIFGHFAQAEPELSQILNQLRNQLRPDFQKLAAERQQLDAKYFRVCFDEEIKARENGNTLGSLFWELEREQLQTHGIPFDDVGPVPKRCQLIRDGWKKRYAAVEESSQVRIQAATAQAIKSLTDLSSELTPNNAESSRTIAWTIESLRSSRDYLKAFADDSEGQFGLVVSGDILSLDRGIEVKGANRAEQLIDGISDTSSNSAKVPLNKFMVITFPEVFRVNRIRMDLMKLNAKRDQGRKYRFLIESSSDEKNWETLVDRTQGSGGWVGWQDLKFEPRPIKALRIKGTFNNRGTFLLVSELEAFCLQSSD